MGQDRTRRFSDRGGAARRDGAGHPHRARHAGRRGDGRALGPGPGRGSAGGWRLSQCRDADRQPAVLAGGDGPGRRPAALGGGQAGRRAGRSRHRRFDGDARRLVADAHGGRRGARPAAARGEPQGRPAGRPTDRERGRGPPQGRQPRGDVRRTGGFCRRSLDDAAATAQEAIGVQAFGQAAAAPRHPGEGDGHRDLRHRRAPARPALCRDTQCADLRRPGEQLHGEGQPAQGRRDGDHRAGRYRRHRLELVARQQAPQGGDRRAMAGGARAQARQRHLVEALRRADGDRQARLDAHARQRRQARED